MSVYRNYPVGILGNNFSVRIHTKCPDHIVIFFSLIDYFALVNVVRNMFEYQCGKFHSNTYIHSVSLGLYPHLFTYMAHPFGTAPARCQNKVPTPKSISFISRNTKSVVNFFNICRRHAEFHLYMLSTGIENSSQYPYISVCTQMSHFCIQKMQIISQTDCFKLGAARRIQLGILSAHTAKNLIHIFHKFYCFFFTHIIVKFSSKFISNIILSVRKSSRPSISVHYMARAALYAIRHFAFFYWADSSFKFSPLINHKYFSIMI